MILRLRKFPLSRTTVLAMLAVSAAIALPMRMLEPDYGLPLLYAMRGERPAPPEALIIGLDKAGVDWLAFHADRLDLDAPELAACLPAKVQEELARAANVEDLPRGLMGCLFLALARLEPLAVVADIHFYGRTDELNDGLLEAGLRHLERPILLEKVQSSAPDIAATRERPAQRFRDTGQTGFFVIEWRDGDTYRYVAAQPDFPGLRNFPRLAAEAAGLPPLPPGEREPHLRTLNLYGPAGSIETVSFLDVLTGQYEVPLAERVVFVGASHPKGMARRDDFETAWSSSSGGDLAGVELAATGFLNLVRQEPLDRLPLGADLAVGTTVGFAILTVALAVTGVRGAAAAAGLGGVYSATAAALFAAKGLWLPFAMVWYAFVPLAVLLGIGFGYRHTSTLLYRLLPRRIAVALLRERSGLRSEALVTEATVLVLDLVGSTAWAELLGETAYNRRMTAFFNLVNGAIDDRGGMVLKYTGDGVVAVFDAERLQGRHASCALDAAVRIAQALARGEDGQPVFHVRMGINSGMVAVGEIGADTRSSIDAMGDAVNVAARLEQMAKDEVVVERTSADNETTILATEEAIFSSEYWISFAIPVGKRTIRGRQGEVQVFRIDWYYSIPETSD